MKKTIATLSLVALLMGATSAFAATATQNDKSKTTAPAAGSTEHKGKAKHKGKGKHTAKPKTAPAATKPSGK